jgi:L-fuculose-phosphate aldolase
MANISQAKLRTLQETGKDLYRLGLVSSHGGNISLRDGDGMWITGTGTMLGRLQERHISFVHLSGSHEGPAPSSDTILHSTVYAMTSQAAAIVHAHAHHATALSFDTELFEPLDFEGQLHLKDVPVIEQGPRQVELLALALQSRRAAILRGHGAYARGQTAWEALHWITALEESAHIAVIRQMLGRG